MIRVGFTGVPGSGKTSTARALVAKLRKTEAFRQVELVQEYARRYISKHGPIEELWEQYRITSKQIEWEDSVINNKLNILVTDSPVFLGFIYASEFDRRTDKDVMVYNDIFKLMTKINSPDRRYDLIFHLVPSIDPVDDGVRAPIHLDTKWREETDMSIRALFKIFPPKNSIIITEPNLDKRVEECLNILEYTWGKHAKN